VRDTIDLGSNPSELGVNSRTNTIYVLLPNDNILSMIDGRTNKLIAGLSFRINPSGSGNIYCNGSNMSGNGYVAYDSGTQIACEAKANGIYPFNFGYFSIFPPTIFGSWSVDSSNQYDNPIRLKITHFGSLTASFKEIIPHDIINNILVGITLAGLTAGGSLLLR
jgi:DNA-binding beta-propeller fold protein YncE